MLYRTIRAELKWESTWKIHREIDYRGIEKINRGWFSDVK